MNTVSNTNQTEQSSVPFFSHRCCFSSSISQYYDLSLSSDSSRLTNLSDGQFSSAGLFSSRKGESSRERSRKKLFAGFASWQSCDPSIGFAELLTSFLLFVRFWLASTNREGVSERKTSSPKKRCQNETRANRFVFHCTRRVP